MENKAQTAFERKVKSEGLIHIGCISWGSDDLEVLITPDHKKVYFDDHCISDYSDGFYEFKHITENQTLERINTLIEELKALYKEFLNQ